MLVQPQQDSPGAGPRVPWRLRDLGLAGAWVLAVGILTIIALGIVFIGPGTTTSRPPAQEALSQELPRVFGVEPVGPMPPPPLPEEEREARDWTKPLVLGASLALQAALLGAAAWFSVRRYSCGWRALGFRRAARGGWWLSLAVVVAVLVAAWLTLGVYFLIVELAGLGELVPESTLPEDFFDNPAIIPLVGVLAIVAAPIAEETFFRGFLFPGLRVRWGTFWAALASGLLFAALHFSLGSIVPFTVIGMLLAWAYVFSGSLWPAIGAHFVFNSVSFGVAVATGGGS
jgi:membrane protease YdiL (CAAX protease family)